MQRGAAAARTARRPPGLPQPHTGAHTDTHALVTMSLWISTSLSTYTLTSRSTVMPSCARTRGMQARVSARAGCSGHACGPGCVRGCARQGVRASARAHARQPRTWYVPSLLALRMTAAKVSAKYCGAQQHDGLNITARSGCACKCCGAPLLHHPPRSRRHQRARGHAQAGVLPAKRAHARTRGAWHAALRHRAAPVAHSPCCCPSNGNCLSQVPCFLPHLKQQHLRLNGHAQHAVEEARDLRAAQ